MERCLPAQYPGHQGGAALQPPGDEGGGWGKQGSFSALSAPASTGQLPDRGALSGRPCSAAHRSSPDPHVGAASPSSPLIHPPLLHNSTLPPSPLMHPCTPPLTCPQWRAAAAPAGPEMPRPGHICTCSTAERGRTLRTNRRNCRILHTPCWQGTYTPLNSPTPPTPPHTVASPCTPFHPPPIPETRTNGVAAWAPS